MGAFLNSLALPATPLGEVETVISRWLALKGFLPRDLPDLFECEPESQRGLWLFANERWVVALYSHMEAEGQRLIHELAKLNRPILRLWVHDSDLWGYDLYQDQDLVASFDSNPNYFGVREQAPLPENGDPALLCELLPVAADENTLARIQRGRALFKEKICRRFCDALGVIPASLDYRDVEGLIAGFDGPATVAGFQMIGRLYEERDRADPPPVPHLHTLTRSAPEDPEQPQFSPDVLAQAQAMARRVRVIVFVLRPILWMVTRLAMTAFWLSRRQWFSRLFGQHLHSATGAFYAELAALGKPTSRQEGRRLINERYRCQVTLAEGIEAMPGGGWNRGSLQFKVGGCMVLGQVLRPSEMRQYFRTLPGAVLDEDQSFFIGQLPARIIVEHWHHPQMVVYRYHYLIQGPRAVYLFHASTQGPLPAEDSVRFRATIESFELLS